MFEIGPPEPRSCAPPFVRIRQNANEPGKFRRRAVATRRFRARADQAAMVAARSMRVLIISLF
jgi:hypothetical protein